MSILMPTMHSLSHFDPFNSQSYTTPLFDSQEHYLQPAAFSPASYTPPTHPFPVDPRWFNTSFSGHASAAPHQFSSMTHSDIISPHTQTDLLSLSPSSTIAPIPPLSGSRNRQGSMSNRVHSLNPARRLQRQSTGSARAISNPHQRMARRSTVSSSPSTVPLQSAVGSPTGIPPSYMHSPPLQSPSDGHDTRATKRRRTNDHDATAVHNQPFSAVPEPPQLLTTVQPPHLAQIHGHGYPPSQTWAGPPSADPLPPHGVSPDQHGFASWNVVSLPYYTTDAHDSSFADHALTPNEVSHSQPQVIPYPSPTVAGPGFFVPPTSPVLDTPLSAHFPPRKVEPDSPRIEEDVVDEALKHGPTEFPPKPYEDGKSPWTPVKVVGKIYGSRLEQMPAIEARMAKLEDSLDHYLDVRAAQALKNSQLPGLDFDEPFIDIKPLGPCRMFGGRIWPTALARRVRRTPRD